MAPIIKKEKKKVKSQRIEREHGGASLGCLACSATPGRRVGAGEGRRTALTISVLLRLTAEPRERKERRSSTNGSPSLSLSPPISCSPSPHCQETRLGGWGWWEAGVCREAGGGKKIIREKETKTQQVCTGSACNAGGERKKKNHAVNFQTKVVLRC